MKAIYVLLSFLLIFSGPMVAAEAPDIELDSEEKMEQILESSDEIMLSEPNVTTATQLLAALPEPEEKAQIAVYNIEDSTGQFKTGGSTVVTQGAVDMMITALQRSRQFKVLDRTDFGDFMNEQNLQAENRLADGEGPILGEMSGADYVLSGAITEYQVDKETGGLGISIAGIGGSKEVARATTALDVRLTDSTTGEVVWSESLKGEIEGEKVGVQAFSFLGSNIVEFETGRGKQEVINLIVRTLIEEAVFKMYDAGI